MVIGLMTLHKEQIEITANFLREKLFLTFYEASAHEALLAMLTISREL